MKLPGYVPTKSYRWNYEHPPQPVEVDIPSLAGDWRFVGLPVESPLGIAAGPLLNGRWCLYYASLGFDVLTYKTVRSSARASYPLPNLLPVDCGPLTGRESARFLPRHDARQLGRLIRHAICGSRCLAPRY